MDNGIAQGGQLLSRSIPQHCYCTVGCQPGAPTGSRNLVTHTESIGCLGKPRNTVKVPSEAPTAVSQWYRSKLRNITPRSQKLTNTKVADNDRKPPIKRIEPDNSVLYKRTQKLFKQRAKAKKAFQEYKASKKQGESPEVPVKPDWLKKPVLDLTIHTPKSVYRPQHWLSSICKEPSTSLSSNIKPSKTGSSCRTRSPEQPRQVSPPSLAYKPPPNDSNYSKVTSSTYTLALTPSEDLLAPVPQYEDLSAVEVDTNLAASKFFDCNKCGKKNLSSFRQLQVHQASKKCKNRQYHHVIHCCQICKRRFDTPQNLKYHVCRFK